MCRKVIASKVKVPNVPKVVSEPEFSALVLPRVESPSRIMSHDNTSPRGARPPEDTSLYDVDVMQRKWHSFVRERKRGNCRHPLTLLRAHLQNGASRDKFLYDKQTRLSGKSYRIFIVQCIALLGRSPFVVRLYSSVRTWKATTRTLPLQDRGGGNLVLFSSSTGYCTRANVVPPVFLEFLENFRAPLRTTYEIAARFRATCKSQVERGEEMAWALLSLFAPLQKRDGCSPSKVFHKNKEEYFF